MLNTNTRQYLIVVVSIKTGRMLYSGNRMAEAAEWLTPGTTFGMAKTTNTTEAEAIAAATSQAYQRVDAGRRAYGMVAK